MFIPKDLDIPMKCRRSLHEKATCKAAIKTQLLDTHVLSEGTICSPISLSGTGGGGYGCTSGCVW